MQLEIESGPEESESLCPYCRSPLSEPAEIVRCLDCNTPHHRECWKQNTRCSIFGCPGMKAIPVHHTTAGELLSKLQAAKKLFYLIGLVLLAISLIAPSDHFSFLILSLVWAGMIKRLLLKCPRCKTPLPGFDPKSCLNCGMPWK